MESKIFFDHLIQLGNLDEKKVFLQDDIIPECKRSNSDIFSSGYWIKYNNELYYFKIRDREDLLKELLGELASKYFQIPTVHYELATGFVHQSGKLVQVYGVLSRFARTNSKKYMPLQDCLKAHHYEFIDGIYVVDVIQDLWPDSPISKEIYAFLVRDFFTNDWDRITNEVLIELGSKPRFGYLCDYEAEFTELQLKIAIPSFYYMTLENEIILDKIKKHDLFIENFEKALKIDLVSMLEQLCSEKQIRLNDWALLKYQNFEQKQKDMILNKLFR